jgi:hypothetical protein
VARNDLLEDTEPLGVHQSVVLVDEEELPISCDSGLGEIALVELLDREALDRAVRDPGDAHRWKPSSGTGAELDARTARLAYVISAMIPTAVTTQPSPENPLRGSCLCGGVRFEVTAPFVWANHCHCSRCRKHSGAFGGTQGRVPRSGFRLLAGEELVRVFRPEDGRVKAFCSVCGSSLFGGEWPEGDEVAIRLGALDGDPGIRPEFHLFVASKAPWDELPDDGLPRYDEAHP